MGTGILDGIARPQSAKNVRARRALGLEGRMKQVKAFDPAIHVNHIETIRRAITTGFDTTEHCSCLTRPEHTRVDMKLVQDLSKRAICVTPTFMALY